MASRASWEETIRLSPDFLDKLDGFIHEPGSRKAAVFWRREIAVDEPRQLELIIKHDLFEGVVLTVNLMDQDAYQFLGGDVRPLAVAKDVLGDLEIVRDGAVYRVTLTEGGAEV